MAASTSTRTRRGPSPSLFPPHARPRALGVCLFLLIPAFGCLQAPNNDRDPSVPAAAPDRWDALPGVAGGFWLEADASPAGQLTAFRWDPPPGAAVPTGPPGAATRHLAFRPWWIEGDDDALVEWALLAFMLRGGQQVPLSYSWFSNVRLTREGNPTQETRYPPYFGPFEFPVHTGAPVDGPGVYFVVFARTRTTARIGLEAVALDHLPSYDENWTTLLPNRSAPPDARLAAPLASTGRGQGGSGAYYFDLYRNHARSTWQNDAFDVRETLDPTAPGLVTRRATLDFDCARGSGWSLIRGAFQADAFYGNYSAHLATYGPALRAQGTLLQAHEGSVAAERLHRFPGGNLWGEGKDASSIQVGLAGRGYTSLQLLAFEFACLGATLRQLTGHPAWNGMNAQVGLLDESEPVPAELWAAPLRPLARPAGAPPTGPRSVA